MDDGAIVCRRVELDAFQDHAVSFEGAPWKQIGGKLTFRKDDLVARPPVEPAHHRHDAVRRRVGQSDVARRAANETCHCNAIGIGEGEVILVLNPVWHLLETHRRLRGARRNARHGSMIGAVQVGESIEIEEVGTALHDVRKVVFPGITGQERLPRRETGRAVRAGLVRSSNWLCPV